MNDLSAQLGLVLHSQVGEEFIGESEMARVRPKDGLPTKYDGIDSYK